MQTSSSPSISQGISIHNELLIKKQLWHALYITNLIPAAGFVAAIASLFFWRLHWMEIILLVTLYLFTEIGVEIGYHRYFSHKSFKTKKPVAFILGVLGSMSAQGPLFYWVANHRRHHPNSDLQGDPHSPYLHTKKGWIGKIYGFWYSHIGWQFDHDTPNTALFAKELMKDPFMRMINKNYYWWIGAGLLIPALIGWLAMGNVQGAIAGLLWGGLTRIFLVNHSTFCINSVCHMFGSQPFKTGDESRNNIFMVVFTLGSSWHNNHHAFPFSASNQLRWWQFDLSFWIIRLLQSVGLAWDIKIPSKHQIVGKQEELQTITPTI